MSFWPFGQNVHSNINKILDDYFQVLHGLEKKEEVGQDVPGTRSPHQHEDNSELESLVSSSSSQERVSLTPQSLNSSFIDNILKESELLNELTRQNNTLLDFICFGYFYNQDGVKVQNIEYLIDQLMECIDKINDELDVSDSQPEEEPHNDSIIPSFVDDNTHSSYLNKATIISEIFALDIWLISESLVKNTSYLNKIWSIIHHPNFSSEKSPLIPIFLKINQNLLTTRQDQYLNFLRSRNTLVDDLLDHIEISVLMDFFLKIISTDKQESPSGIIELVHEQNLINKLLRYLDNDRYAPDIQACAGDFIKALIAISANAPLDDMSIGPNSLTRQLASEECVSFLLDTIVLKRGNALITAVSIVIELIRKNNSDYDQVNLLTTTIESNPPSMRDPIYLGIMLKKFASNLNLLYQILIDIEEDESIPFMINQLGEKFKPIGFERFKVVELIAELLHCSNMGLMNSKKAERIVKERSDARSAVAKQLQDALADLDLNDSEKDVKPEENPSNLIDDELDESFEIPYVNPKQNAKLRNNPTIGDLFKIKLYDNGVLPKIIELFLDYPWNNFWHNVIFDIVQQIFNGRMDFSYNSFLVYSLFNSRDAARFMIENSVPYPSNFQITRDLILQGYKKSYDFYEVHRTTLGYMGHLVLIAEEIVKFSKVYKVELISPDIQKVLQDEDWIFYSEDVLNDTRIMYSKILGGNDYLEESNDNVGNDSDNASEASDITGTSLSGGNLINVSELNPDQSPILLNFATQTDLHKKLRDKLIRQSREEVERKNKEKGVIILGMPSEDTNENLSSESNINIDEEDDKI
ncbi:LAFE_0F17326g1_1 [Lachancea fermentati]|uniref:LAFE_0F17326g1_1 n=1 Tax=Lachancea fermentati TaxID=4955 RepID=A0A1G4MG81_LACFM|nr:LAFE_0F17326g1_1 [Lachancea fermentati]